ncbi:MAG: hypothetical protein NC116_06860 [Clostridium sp.]|nr:hypothetical protein [Clostridium sp.]
MAVRRKHILAVLSGAMAVFAIVGAIYIYSGDAGGAGDDVKDGGMTVAVTPTLDCLPVYVAQETGIADEMGCILILQEHASVADCDSALAGGSAVCVSTDCVRAEMLMERKKADLKKQFVLVRNPNACLYLFANRKARIKSASQMKDKIIAVDRKGADALMAQYVLDSVKLVDARAFLVNIQSIPIRMSMLANNTIDAAVLPEPQATVARKTGHENLYAEYGRNGNTYGAFLLKKADMDMFVSIYNRACDSINKNGIGHYDSILIKRMSVPEKLAKYIPTRRFVKL